MEDGVNYGKEVDFFLRIHGHLPDQYCGERFPFGKCKYSPDGEPINMANDYVVELRMSESYREKERVVQEAQKKRWEGGDR